ncbi:hypothetical protein U1Q18_007981, partial [Sarracenia purpurea var. burkii]
MVVLWGFDDDYKVIKRWCKAVAIAGLEATSVAGFKDLFGASFVAYSGDGGPGLRR